MYQDQTFMLQDSDPQTGYICFKLGDGWNDGTCDDNDIPEDDCLYLRYSKGITPVITDQTPVGNLGDMNLGKQEMRRLHWVEERPAEEDEGEGEGDSDSTSGEKEEKEPVYVHMTSNWGIYDSVDAAKADASTSVESAPEWDESDVPPMDSADGSGSYWSAGENNCFWEYARVYDSSESAKDKIWLNGDAGERQYIRSELDSVPFTVKTVISNSRGNKQGVKTPTVSWRIYGISPDTDEEGVLLRQFNETTDQNLDGGAEVFKGVAAALGEYETSEAESKEKVMNSDGSGAMGDHDTYWPKIRVVADVSEDVHGESGYTGLENRSPYENALHSSDHTEYTFEAESDDMFISEVMVKDSEGIVVYHTWRDRAGQPLEQQVPANGASPVFDREEDYVLYVKVKQNKSASHVVKHPTIDVKVDPLYNGSTFTTSYINRVQENGTTGTYTDQMDHTGVVATEYEFPFRAKEIKGTDIRFDIAIDDIHGDDGWRENIWDESDDHLTFDMQCTTANMAMSQDIELYNSKNNLQNYITFGEYLKFKFDIQHTGRKDRPEAQMVVGGTDQNPLPSMRWEVYNADALTIKGSGANRSLVYNNSGTDFTGRINDVKKDPKAALAKIWPRNGENNLIAAETRLFPGLGEYGFASHVQVWSKEYIAQTHVTSTGNIAAYGHIVVYGKIDDRHSYNGTNTYQGQEDLVQKEFIGEKNIKITDMSATARSAISTGTWTDTYDADNKKNVYGTVNVQLALENVATSYTDPTVIDKVYVQFWTRPLVPETAEDEEWKLYEDETHKPIEVEIPTGSVVLTDTVLEKMEIPVGGLEIRAGVNVGKWQTHYEYVYQDSALNKDPFSDNYKEFTVIPNLPSTDVCPDCVTDPEGESPDSIDPVKDAYENDDTLADPVPHEVVEQTAGDP